jgi:septal ring factor EnvC (AmiA/AmiB activator)
VSTASDARTASDLRAFGELERCVQRHDYAAAACLTTRPEVLDGIARLAAYAAEQRAQADEARREAAAARLAEAERARIQAAIGPLLDEVIGVLAEALGVPKDSAATRRAS